MLSEGRSERRRAPRAQRECADGIFERDHVDEIDQDSVTRSFDRSWTEDEEFGVLIVLADHRDHDLGARHIVELPGGDRRGDPAGRERDRAATEVGLAANQIEVAGRRDDQGLRRTITIDIGRRHAVGNAGQRHGGHDFEAAIDGVGLHDRQDSGRRTAAKPARRSADADRWIGVLLVLVVDRCGWAGLVADLHLRNLRERAVAVATCIRWRFRSLGRPRRGPRHPRAGCLPPRRDRSSRSRPGPPERTRFFSGHEVRRGPRRD